MINKLIENLAMKQLYKAANIYKKGNYRSVLKVYNRSLSSTKRYVVYQNIFRVICLLRLNDKEWENEYLMLIKSGELDLLGSDDKKYIQQYIGGFLDDKIDLTTYSDYDIQAVSKDTKAFFY